MTDSNYAILEKLIQDNEIVGALKDRYDLNQEFSRDDFITLIYSMGFITIKHETFGQEFAFEIPNYVIKMLYFNYFAIELKNRNNLTINTDIVTLMRNLALGDTQPINKQLSDIIKLLSNRDHQGFDEKYFHVVTLALLSFGEFYFIDSQPEKNRKYPDILLIGQDERVPNNYLFELKWAKSKDNYETKRQEGINQVKEYLELESIQAIPKLKSFVLLGSKNGVEFVLIKN